MLRLKNIEKNDQTIRADYYPEGTEERGSLVIDCVSGRMVSKETTSFDDPLGGYLFHALQALRRHIGSEKVPSEQIVMWY